MIQHLKKEKTKKLSFSRKLICLHLIFQFGTYCIKMIAMHWGDRSTGRHYVCIASGGEVFECCNLHSNVKLIITPHINTSIQIQTHKIPTTHIYTSKNKNAQMHKYSVVYRQNLTDHPPQHVLFNFLSNISYIQSS